ncbi:cytidylate kinase family protein [Methylobacter sp. S3L5C]|uniref:cytidylate kinase family protein n=1 Tax=Methylobacter sp. S3L5C TaxID=2839024 RepID=UPI001FABF1D5|nr:cytidylate kinase family protein [Methylobacter sp. S3L5C]UOA07079.1 AAA family ATPase [Methylobacter sp. S3L5C]
MKKIIVMSGDIGSGKSSVATALKQLTDYDIIGTGTIQRAIAKRRGVTTLELNKISQTDRSIDDEIDSYVIETGKTKDHLILDSRLAWHFIPTAFKVFLSVDAVVGAERVFNASRNDENNPSLEITLENNLKRQTIEDQRFNQLYNINFRKYANYNLIIDTSYTSPEAIAKKIKACFDDWLRQGFYSSLWIAPRKLLPTHAIKEFIGDAPNNNEAQANQPVNVFVYNGFIYIQDGHKEIIDAHKAGIELVSANILTEEPADELSPGLTASEIANNVSLSMLHDWEAALGFKYSSYPEKL